MYERNKNCTGYLFRHVASPEELRTVYDILGTQFSPSFTHENCSFNDLASHYPKDRQMMLVVENEGRIIGGALGFGNTLRIIAITPSYRGLGLGRRLIQTFEVVAMRKEVRMVALVAHPDTVDFYTKMGYRGKRGRSKELPLPGRVLEFRLRKWEEKIGNLEEGQVVCIDETGKVPSLF